MRKILLNPDLPYSAAYRLTQPFLGQNFFRKKTVYHPLIWAAIIGIYFLLGSSVKPAEETIVRAIANGCCLSVIHYIVRGLVQRHSPTTTWWREIRIMVAIIIPMGFLRVLVESQWLHATVFTEKQDTPFSTSMVVYLNLFFFIMGMLWAYVSAIYCINKKQKRSQYKMQQQLLKHAEAELSLIKSRLNPHFLFNTLNSIYGAALVQHPKTPDMILMLSDLLRYITYTTQEKSISVEKEVAQCRALLLLHQEKQQCQLPVQWHINPQTAQRQLPPMMLLNLVENALKHGNIDSGQPNAALTIRAEQKGEELELSVSNSYDPAAQKSPAGGLGLQNLQQRLALEFPGKHTLHIQPGTHLFTVLIRIYTHE